MKLQVVIPYLSTLWMLEDCLQSFGKSDVPILVVDNSPDSHAKNLQINEWGPDRDKIEIIERPMNVGISASWNMGLKKGADQTLIVSQSVRFAPAEFSRRASMSWGLDHVGSLIEQHGNSYGLTFGDQGYHLISIGKGTVEKIGLFDENFLAYGEDDDYHHRQDLAGIALPDFGDYHISNVHSIAFAVQKRNNALKTHNQSRMRDYYSFKWCSSPDKHPGDYEHPFNDQTKGLDFWPEVRHG